ncbi:hypothetical protein ABXJ11_23200 [Escherichia coli]
MMTDTNTINESKKSFKSGGVLLISNETSTAASTHGNVIMEILMMSCQNAADEN